MVSVVDGAIMALHVIHQIASDVITHHIAHHTHTAAKTAKTASWCWCRRKQLGWVTIRQHNNHFLSFSLSNQVVEDVVHTSHLVVHLFRISRTAKQIEHWILLVLVRIILRRKIDDGVVHTFQAVRIVVNILHQTMRHLLDVMSQRARLGRDFQEAVLKALIGEILRTERVHHAHAIHHKTIRVHVGSSRSECGCPHTIRTFRHGVSASKLHIHLHILGIGVLILESHRTIRIADSGLLELLSHGGGCTKASRHTHDISECLHFIRIYFTTKSRLWRSLSSEELP